MDKIYHFVEDSLHKEYPNTNNSAVKREEPATVDNKDVAEEPVAEVVLVLVEITEFVSDGKEGEGQGEHPERNETGGLLHRRKM